MKKKKLLVTIPDGYHFRYLVDSGVIDELQKDFNIVLITTAELAQHFGNASENGFQANLQIEVFSCDQSLFVTRMQRMHSKLKYLRNNKLTETINIKNELQAKNLSVTDVLTKAIARTPMVRDLSMSLLEHFYRNAQVGAIFKKHKPDFLLVSTPAQKFFDAPFVYYAKKNGIVSISPVYSWDNLTGKGPFLFNPEYLLVWNSIMKAEAIEYHDYRPDDVFVCGAPVFDNYAHLKTGNCGKDEFFNAMSLDKDLPLVTVTTIPQIYFGNSHLKLAEKIIELRNKKIPDVNLLIRPHPLDETNYSSLNGIRNVYVDYYGSQPDKSLKLWKPSKNNVEHLGRTMKYSDIVINIASTITIDAALFDTPVINLNYDIKMTEADYEGSIKRYYHYTHYKKVIEQDACWLVNDENELVEAICQYLKDPTIHSRGRNNLVNTMAVYTDGMSYKRIAEKVREVSR